MCRSSGTLITIRYATHTRAHARAYDVSPLPGLGNCVLRNVFQWLTVGIKNQTVDWKT